MIATTAPVRSKPVSSGRRKQKIPEPVIVSDEESVEDESITRCVCGESHSIGLMVCCDQCEVWQHCECMGLEEHEIPDQYYCELCKPSDHVEVKGYDKTRRYYKPCSPVSTETVEKRIPKRRTTFNSREASISLEEVLAFRNAIEQSKTYDASGIEITNGEIQVQYGSVHSIEESITILQDYAEENGNMAKQARPKRNGHSKRNLEKEQTSKTTAKSTREKKTRPRNNPRNSSWTSNSTFSSSTTHTVAIPTASSTVTSASRRSNHKVASRSRTSTPQPEVKTPTSCGSQLFEHFSQSARENSPPAKVRLPSHRMTIVEMNRRANQILEYICSMQVEIATSKRRLREADDDEEDEEESRKRRALLDAQISEAMTKAAQQIDDDEDSKENRRPTPILIPGQFDHASSPSSSLSSASTIPLDDDRMLVDHEKGVAQEALERMRKPKSEQSSMEIMDMLTREVITFQRRFGPLSYGGSLENTEEYDGPPVTRSREGRSAMMDRNW